MDFNIKIDPQKRQKTQQQTQASGQKKTSQQQKPGSNLADVIKQFDNGGTPALTPKDQEAFNELMSHIGLP